jgi:hypothetical protein
VAAIFAFVASFERRRIAERIGAGLARDITAAWRF